MVAHRLPWAWEIALKHQCEERGYCPQFDEDHKAVEDPLLPLLPRIRRQSSLEEDDTKLRRPNNKNEEQEARIVHLWLTIS